MPATSSRRGEGKLAPNAHGVTAAEIPPATRTHAIAMQKIGHHRKVVCVALLKRRRSVSKTWIAGRLAMGIPRR
ncbi:MAG: hypothetical protein Q7R22_014890 [Verrucomicrobiota bacterium JB025]|nr:hypothetical protein [Verrucomicrobiota bacterium JB025]